MSQILNPSTRNGGSDVVVVPPPAPSSGTPDPPIDDNKYVMENGMWIPLDLSGYAPAHDHPYAPSSHSHSYAPASHSHSFDGLFNMQAGSTTSAATINNGNSWTNKESAWSLTFNTPGRLIVIGTCWLQHNVSSGDPECRVSISGAMNSQTMSPARLGTGSVGGVEIVATVTTTTRCYCTGGTISIQRQVRNHISSGTGHQWWNFDLVAMFSPTSTGT